MLLLNEFKIPWRHVPHSFLQKFEMKNSFSPFALVSKDGTPISLNMTKLRLKRLNNSMYHNDSSDSSVIIENNVSSPGILTSEPILSGNIYVYAGLFLLGYGVGRPLFRNFAQNDVELGGPYIPIAVLNFLGCISFIVWHFLDRFISGISTRIPWIYEP